MKQARIYIDGTTCINCQIRIENELKKEPALTDISVSYEAGEASFSYNPDRISLKQITDMINKMGYFASSEKLSCKKLKEYLDFSNRFCGLSVQKHGAIDSYPTLPEMGL